MKILVISNLFPPQVIGGYERAIADYSNFLHQKGHEIYVCTSNTQGLATSYATSVVYPFTVERSFKLVIQWTENCINFLPPAEAFTAMSHNNVFIEQCLADYQPDIVLVGNVEGLNIEVIEKPLERGIPVVHYVMNPHAGYSPELAPRSHLFCCVALSQWIAENLRRLGYPFAKIPVIYPGVRPEEFYCQSNFEFDYLKIAYSSLVMHYKGADVLVDALYLLHTEGIKFSAAIAGGSLQPDYVKELQDFCQEKGIADKVKFTGLLTKAQLKELYQASNVLVFPSRFEEPFGISQIEAMMAGLLLVTSGTGGSGEAIEDGVSGLLFPSDDPYALAEILYYLASDPSEWRRIAIAGQKRALAQFTMERTVAELETLMQEMISLK